MKWASAFFVGGLFVGTVIGYTIIHSSENILAESRPYRQNNNSYEFIAPLLYYETPESKQFTEYSDLEDKIIGLISGRSHSQVTDVSVYFRDLELGRWVGINENEAYHPRSLLKVAYLIAYLKKLEETPNLLRTKLVYTPEIQAKATQIDGGANSSLQVSKDYYVEELLSKMIVESDNAAKDILLSNLDEDSLMEIFTDLGIALPTDESGSIIMSAKTYSSLLRVLYNSTYLNRRFSEFALKMLNQTEFTKGLRAGVPSDIAVAHKFGVEIASGQDRDIQLHDCGIVYNPGSHYLLCVMTKGDELSELVETIREISSLVYQEVGAKN